MEMGQRILFFFALIAQILQKMLARKFVCFFLFWKAQKKEKKKKKKKIK